MEPETKHLLDIIKALLYLDSGESTQVAIFEDVLVKAADYDVQVENRIYRGARQVVLTLTNDTLRVNRLAERLKSSQHTVPTPNVLRRAIKEAWGIDL